MAKETTEAPETTRRDFLRQAALFLGSAALPMAGPVACSEDPLANSAKKLKARQAIPYEPGVYNIAAEANEARNRKPGDPVLTADFTLLDDVQLEEYNKIKALYLAYAKVSSEIRLGEPETPEFLAKMRQARGPLFKELHAVDGNESEMYRTAVLGRLAYHLLHAGGATPYVGMSERGKIDTARNAEIAARTLGEMGAELTAFPKIRFVITQVKTSADKEPDPTRLKDIEGVMMAGMPDVNDLVSINQWKEALIDLYHAAPHDMRLANEPSAGGHVSALGQKGGSLKPGVPSHGSAGQGARPRR